MAANQEIFRVENLAPGVHLISEVDRTHTYLVEGADWALLIDTGLGNGDIREVVEGITRHPIIVANTHAHWEHIGGNHRFDTIAVHPAEAALVEAGMPAETMRTRFKDYPEELEYLPTGFDVSSFEIRPSSPTYLLSHGEAIDLGGGRILEALHTPGHSPGSICLLDEANRLLFSGDTVHTGLLQADLAESDLQQYAETAKSLYALGWDTNLVLPGHGETPLDGGILLELGSGFERLLDGEGMYEAVSRRGGIVCDVKLGRFSVRIVESLRQQ